MRLRGKAQCGLRSFSGITPETLARTRNGISASGFWLLNEPDRHRVAIKFSIARLDRGDDDEDGIQDPEDSEEKEADQDQAKDRGHNVVDQHRDLEVKRFFAVRVDLRRFVAFHEPDDEWRQQMAGEMQKDTKQSAGVAKCTPTAHVWDG